MGESTMSTTLRRRRWRGIEAACEPVRSFGFESYSPRVIQLSKSTSLGDSESILRNKRYLRETAQRLIGGGVVPQEDGWNGWLGRYQKALRVAVSIPESQRVNQGS